MMNQLAMPEEEILSGIELLEKILTKNDIEWSYDDSVAPHFYAEFDHGKETMGNVVLPLKTLVTLYIWVQPPLIPIGVSKKYIQLNVQNGYGRGDDVEPVAKVIATDWMIGRLEEMHAATKEFSQRKEAETASENHLSHMKHLKLISKSLTGVK